MAKNRYKLIIFGLIILIIFSTNIVIAMEGSGSATDPYIIKTASELNEIRNIYWKSENNNAYYELGNDIDLQPFLSEGGEGYGYWNEYGYNFGWLQIGASNAPFTGTFDGNGYTIYNLYIDRRLERYVGTNDNTHVGLFGHTEGSTLKNIKLENVEVKGDFAVGALVGSNEGTVINCSAGGFVNGNLYEGATNAYVGGLIGKNKGNVVQSYTDVMVGGGASRAGGLIGYSTQGTISECYSTGTVYGQELVGGLIGELYSGTLNKSYATGTVQGPSGVGGLVGFIDPAGVLSNSYATGDIIGNNAAGGLVGINIGTINNTYATGYVQYGSNVAGLVASNFGNITNSYYDKETTEQNDTGKGVGKTTAEMQQEIMYVNSGWDFADIWWIEEDQSYPKLRAFGGIKPNSCPDLKSMAVSAGNLKPNFSTNITSYELDVKNNVSSITLTPEAVDPYAGIEINGSSSRSIDLSVGDNSINVKVTAEDGTSKTYSIAVYRNNKSTVSDSSKIMSENNTLSFLAADFCENYNDIENDELVKIQITSLAANGTLKINDTVIGKDEEILKENLQKISYEPEQEWNGKTSFDWRGSDGIEYSTNSATMTLLVKNELLDIIVDEDAADTTIDLTNVFIEIDNDDSAVTKTVVNNTNTSLLTAEITENTLILSYKEDQYGTADITIRGSSDGKTADETFTVTVNPVNEISDVNVNEDAPDTIIDLTDVFSYIDNDDSAVTKTVASNTNTSLLSVEITGNTLILSYKKDQYGTANITIQGNSSGKTADETFTVTVNPVNDNPIILQPSDISGDEASKITPEPVEFTDVDFTINNWPYNMFDGYTASVDWGDGSAKEYVGGYPPAYINSPFSIGSHTYTQEGQYSVKIIVKEQKGLLNYIGSNSATFTITVNDAVPEAGFNWSPVSSEEGSEISFSDTSTSYPDSLTAWDWDFGDGKTSIEQSPVHTYTDTGIYTVSLTVTDSDGSTDTISKEIEITDIVPTVTVEKINTNGSQGDELILKAIGSGYDGDIFEYRFIDNGDDSILQDWSENDIFKRTENDNKSLEIRVEIRDEDNGIDADDSTTTTMNWENVAPIASDGLISIPEDTGYIFAVEDFAFNDVQDSTDSLQKIKITTLESKGSLKLAGSEVSLKQEISREDIIAGKLSFKAAADENGVAYDSFKFKVSDGIDYSTESYLMTIDVAAVDDPPTVDSPILDLSVDEDAADTIIDLADVFTDRDNDDIAIIKTVVGISDSSLVTASISGDILTLDYGQNQNGKAEITIRGSSNGKTVDAKFMITVNAVNDAPVLEIIDDKGVKEGEKLKFVLLASDVDNDQLYFSAENLPLKAELDERTGEFSWRPYHNQAGDYHLTFTVKDREGENALSDKETVLITIEEAPLPQIMLENEDLYQGNNLKAGDIITYQIEARNTGTVNLVNTELIAPIPVNTEYVSGSTYINNSKVEDSNGNCSLLNGIIINGTDDDPGSLSTGSEVLIEYRVRLEDNMVAGAVISNQVSLSGDVENTGEPITILSDDPDTEKNNDTTLSLIDGRAAIDSIKQVLNDNQGDVYPGDILTYIIKIWNPGSKTATGVILNDIIPQYTELIEGSLTGAAQKVNTTDYQLDDDSLQVDLGEIKQGEYRVVSYKVKVNEGIETKQIPIISSQGLVSADGLPAEKTDFDGDDSNGDQPTEIAVGKFPVIDIALQAVDINGGQAETGDVIEFVIILKNSGSSSAADLTINSLIPNGLNYLAGTTKVNNKVIVDEGGNSTLETGYNYGDILIGEEVIIKYRTVISSAIADNTTLESRAEYTAQALAEYTGRISSQTISDQTVGESGTIIVSGSSGQSNIQGSLINDNISLEGWITELYYDTYFVDSKTVDSQGKFAFDGLIPGPDYILIVKHPASGVNYKKIELISQEGNIIIKENIEPNGIIYDSENRQPLAGVEVRFLDSSGNPLADRYLLSCQQDQQTATDGWYRFDPQFAEGLEDGEYSIEVVSPQGYVFPSKVIKPEEGSFDPGNNSNSSQVSSIDSVPVEDEDTQYYLTFDLADGSAEFTNNHIPLDKIPGNALKISKTAVKDKAAIGDIITYQINIKNNYSYDIGPVSIVDEIPAGFKYVKDSSKLNDEAVEPEGSRTLTWTDFYIETGQELNLSYSLVVGSGVNVGCNYANKASVKHQQAETIISNTTQAIVTIITDPLLSATTFIGKVFMDKNANGLQDSGEEGLSGIKLVTLDGRIITTDEDGRYHIAGTAVKGSSFVIKIDEDSLPEDLELITKNPQLIKITAGLVSKVNWLIQKED